MTRSSCYGICKRPRFLPPLAPVTRYAFDHHKSMTKVSTRELIAQSSSAETSTTPSDLWRVLPMRSTRKFCSVVLPPKPSLPSVLEKPTSRNGAVSVTDHESRNVRGRPRRIYTQYGIECFALIGELEHGYQQVLRIACCTRFSNMIRSTHVDASLLVSAHRF